MAPSFWLRVAVSVLARPHLWATAIRQTGRLARPRWWRRAPFLPLPDAAYLQFRFETQYGDAPPVPDDVVAYLEWCHRMPNPRSARGHRR